MIMNRSEWDALTDDERKAWAWEHGKASGRCITWIDDENRCLEPAGTPWGDHWCARHDAERMVRINNGLQSIKRDMETETA